MALKTGNQFIDALGGTPWPKTAENTSLVDGALLLTVFFDNDTSAGHSTGGAWTPNEQSAFWNALHAWSSVAKVRFLGVDNVGAADLIERKVSKGELSSTVTGHHDNPGESTHVGMFNTKTDWRDETLQIGGARFGTLVHELGHAIGLAHPHDTGQGTGTFPAPPPGEVSLDARINTVMSYNGRADTLNYGHIATPMAFDIAAIQLMYGAVAKNDGDTIYTLSDANAGGTYYSCIWDTSGIDCIRYSGTKNATIDLRAATLLNAPGGGGFLSSVTDPYGIRVEGGFTIAADITDFDHNGDFSVVIENAIGGDGNDTINGNHVDNWLDGWSGNDTLNGWLGADTMLGGYGDDIYFVDNPGDRVFEIYSENGGKDKIYTTIDYHLGGEGKGWWVEELQYIGTGNFVGNGNNLNNAIVGAGGNDWLYGHEGKDSLFGMGGIDHLYGGIGDDWLKGEGDGDFLYGDADNDTLDGGLGADTMYGGFGNDIYLVDDWGDRVFEEYTAAGGKDKIYTTIDYHLGGEGKGWWVEDLQYIGTGNFIGNGNNLDNAIVGAGGNDWLYGHEGKDSLFGMGGIDHLYGGIGDDWLKGEGDGDFLYGDADNDTLDGGLGADTMYGGFGNDIYLVDDWGDRVFEEYTAAGGKDKIYTTIDYHLGGEGKGWWVEDLQYIGTGNFIGNGNNLDNAIVGAGGNDWLYGHEGKDSLFGMGGIDHLYGGIGDDWLKGEGDGDFLYGDADNDTLDGGLGADTMYGGFGNDIYLVDDWGDRVFEEYTAAGGKDKIYTTIDYHLGGEGKGWWVEDLQYIGTGNFIGNGNNLDNAIAGAGGNDQLYGWEGKDGLFGGSGIDSLWGGIGDDWLKGEGDGDFLFGEAGNDTLEGGHGNDIIDGGANTDTAVFTGPVGAYAFAHSGTDILITGVLDGTDTVRDNVELFKFSDRTLTRAELVAAISATTLTDAANTVTLPTFGGTYDARGGDDTLFYTGGEVTTDGGIGTDTLDFSKFGSAVWANLTVGFDAEIRTKDRPDLTSGTWRTIGDLGEVENLCGSAFNDELYGNSGVNRINGGGGHDLIDGRLGADIMTGGLGNDTYVVDNVGDVVTEAANAGTDTVRSWITRTLDANVENLELTGTSAINGTGNALANTITGNSAANTLDGGTGIDTLLGGLGNDIYITDGGDTITEAANAGTDEVRSSATVTALWANVENLVLTGTSAINGTGNALANKITGNGAANTLDGGTGIDTLLGGLGNDIYITDGGDTITEAANAGTDEVRSSATVTALWANVENLVLTGTSAINGTGNALANKITGNGAANTLDGGTGIDTLLGGLGNDIYITDGGDTITEAANAGTDEVRSSASVTALWANVENLVLTGTSAINGTGNALANKITGNGAANTLDGGTGIDTLLGGLGNDIYITDGGDTITEAANAGTDEVRSSASVTALWANVENLVLTGTSAINGTGNALANKITGNGAANTLDGGTGIDTLLGGLGNDIYITDGGDTITEAANAGTDEVRSSATVTALWANVENLVLTGTSAINGTGNALANKITGNGAANTLDGGTGIDTLLGGLGNDIYITDGGDTITEAANAGTDEVRSSASVTALWANVENLVLNGTSAINGTGNALANTITGNSAANMLNGGAGIDTLRGNGGNDTFVFNFGQANGDTIVDFNGLAAAAGDSLRFVGYGAGATFTQIDATHWQVDAGATHEVITFSNAAAVHASDYMFL